MFIVADVKTDCMTLMVHIDPEMVACGALSTMVIRQIIPMDM